MNKKLLREDAKKFRKKVIEEIYSKSPEEITDLELYIIKYWLTHYGEEVI